MGDDQSLAAGRGYPARAYADEEKTLARVVTFLSDAQGSFAHTLRRMMGANHLGTPEHPRAHPVVASAARKVLNKSENERSGELSTAMSFVGSYRDPTVAAPTAACDVDRRGDAINPAHKIPQLFRRLQAERVAYLQRLEDPPAMPLRTRTIHLLHPIVDDAGRPLTELTLTEPRLDEMMAIDDQTGEIWRRLATVAVFARLPLSVAEQLPWSDLWRLNPEIQLLTGSGLK